MSSSSQSPPPPDPDSPDPEVRIQAAIIAVRQSGTKPNGCPCLSLRQAAKDFKVPRSTLTDRYNGLGTRQKVNEGRQRLTAAQESVLVDWIKVMGRRGIPLTPTTVIDYASDIAGISVGKSWVKRFMARHPDLKVKWTTSLEECRARALNPALIQEFYDVLKGVIADYNVPAENIYNMDEKGIQLGLGKRVAALVDRDAKSVYQVEDGNRELVTVIEAVSADGTALHPSVIYQGARRDLEWARNNPCNASISHSPKGWTDQELGLKWLQRDFEPASAARNVSDGYRLLILDGHNSHCTYQFVKYAAAHRIIVLCLPSHTTHALQPLDVSIFGPLAAAWKAQVNRCSRELISIRKNNLLIYYKVARDRGMTTSNIVSAFAKTGIWPLNPNAIPQVAFEPSRNTTTQAAQPLPAMLPPFLLPIPEVPASSSSGVSSVSSENVTVTSSSAPTSTSTATSASTDVTVQAPPKYIVVGMPAPLPHTASRHSLRAQNRELRAIADLAIIQVQKDHAQMVLMDRENERLRKRAFTKEKKKPKRLDSTHARHMTAEESMDALARAEWESNMKEVLREASSALKSRRKAIVDHEKHVAADARAEERQRKEEERLAKKATADVEKARRQAERSAKQAEKKAAEAERKATLAQKKAALVEKKAALAEQKALKQRARQEAAVRKAVTGTRNKRTPARGTPVAVVDEDQNAPPMARPVPRPRYKSKAGESSATENGVAEHNELVEGEAYATPRRRSMHGVTELAHIIEAAAGNGGSSSQSRRKSMGVEDRNSVSTRTPRRAGRGQTIAEEKDEEYQSIRRPRQRAPSKELLEEDESKEVEVEPQTIQVPALRRSTRRMGKL